MKLLHAHYGRRMRYAFRHLPLTELHPRAGLAAEAAEAAGAQGKFWEMHDQLSDHREHLKPRHLRGYAKELELDMPRFDFALKHQVHRPRIDEHVEGGRPCGATRTPTFFVDGALVDVSAGLERLLEAIELSLHVRGQR
jgi:protein-disulfide isomerase